MDGVVIEDVAVLAAAGAFSMAVGLAAFLVARRLLMRLGPLLALGSALTVIVGVVNVVALDVTMLLGNVVAVLVALTLSGAVAGGFAFMAARDIRNDLAVIEAAAGQIARGDLASRVPMQGTSDLSRIGTALNDMAEAMERSQSEKETLEASRRELIAAVSHDLRTPIAALRTLTEALTARVVYEPQEVTRYLNTMVQQIRSLSALIDDMFELARLQEGELVLAFQSVDVAEVIRETADAVEPEARARGLDLRVDIAPQFRQLAIDPARVQRVLFNLLQNAVEHTAAGGSVTVLARERASGIEVEVADTGSGISAEDLPRIFERLFSRDLARARGTGLGLAICKAIVEAHGGSISARSRVGEGTQVAFWLPRAGDVTLP